MPEVEEAMKALWLALTLVVLAGCGSDEQPAAPDQPGDDAGGAATGKTEGTEDPGRKLAPTPREVDPVAALESEARSPDDETRLAAADKLGETEERHRERAAILLESMLGDESPEVRQVVANSIARLGLPRLTAMRDQLRIEENDDVRRALVTAIFTVGGADAIPDLLTAANDVMLDENFRAFAIDALGRLQATKAREILEEASEDISPVVRRAAVIALGQLASEASLKPLGERVGDNDKLVQIEAIRALKLMNKRQSVTFLIRNLDATDPEVLDELNMALEHITGQKQGYDRTKTVEENSEATEKWRAWWEENKSYY